MKRFLLISIAVCLLSGCAVHEDSCFMLCKEIPVQDIFIGMTMKQVSEKLGAPSAHIGRRQYANGEIDVYLYEVYKINILDDSAARKEYFFYFSRGRLVRWDRPGDWQPEADQLMRSIGR